MRRVFFILTFVFLFVMAGALLSLALGSHFWILLFLFLSLALLPHLYLYSDRFLLSILGAKTIDERIAPELFEVMGKLLGECRIAIMPGAPPNVISFGSRNSHLVFTDEALSSFSSEEAEIALMRMSHKKHMMLATWVCVTGFILGYLGFLGKDLHESGGVKRFAAFFLLPFLFLSSLFEGLFLSGGMVLEEDRERAMRSGKPDILAKVIRLCEETSRRKNPRRGNASLSFLFLVNPYRDSFSRFFVFAPPTEKRIRKLNEISKGMGREIV